MIDRNSVYKYVLEESLSFREHSTCIETTADEMSPLDSHLEEEKISLLKEWSKEKDEIPELSEKDLRIFFQSCNYNEELTKNTIISYYKLRVQSPEFFSNRDPSATELLTASTNGYSFPLPGETKDGYKIFMCGYLHTDTSTFVFLDTMKRFLMAMDLWLSKLESCPGIIVLIDCKNSAFGHMIATPMDATRKMVIYFQEALPVRLQAVYFINISPAMNFFLSIVQPFLSTRITNLIHKFVKGSENYLTTIPREILPIELGGEAGTLQQLNDAMTQDLIDHAEWFQEGDQQIRSLVQKNRKDKENINNFD